MKAISLFAGIGGFDLAMQRAGIEAVSQVEIDPQCRAVLAQHWPEVARHDDICTFRAGLGQADIVCGGFPCQDLSVAGKRLGFGGVRSSLFFEMMRIINECRPLYVIWENVPGLLSANNGRDFAAVLMALDNIGYSGAWTMLDAQHFGLAQRRRRVFGVFTCGSGGAGRCAEILSFGPRLRGDTPARQAPGESIAYALAAGAGSGSKFGSGREGQDTFVSAPLGAHHGRQDLDNESYVVSGTIGFGGHGYTPNDTGGNLIAGALSSRQPSSDASCGNQGHILTMPESGHGLWTEGDAGTPRMNREPSTVLAFESRIARNGRGRPDAVAPPLKAQSGGTGKGDGGAHKRQDRPNGGLYVNETETALTIGSTDLTAIVQPVTAFAWQQGVGPNDRSYPVRAGDYAGSVTAERVDAIHSATGVRRLTPRECERLQGFPDDWTSDQSDSARYRMLGNAVAVPVVEWIMRRLAQAVQP